MLKISFRDDDLDEPLDSFLNYNILMEKYGMPVAYAVIPSRVSKENADFFCKLKNKQTKNNIEFLQHGWSHTNYNSSNLKKAEFSVRDSKVEHIEIVKGYNKMHELFKNDFTPIFVPSFHSYNKDTWFSAKSAGCKGFSAKAGMPEYEGLKSIPVNLLFDVYEDNTPKFRKSNDIILEFLLLSKKSNTIVFLTHHKTIGESEFKELEKVLHFLKLMSDKGKLKFVSFSELLNLELLEMDLDGN